MSTGFEVGLSATLRALHRIPWLPPPEGDLHPHDYRVDVVVERASLDERGMVCDLDVLEAALGNAVAALEGQDLETIRPAEAEAVTVEILAQWFHATLAGSVQAAGGEMLAVRVWESASAFGGYRAPASTSSE
ncbi:MAG: 6-carboxytetrahydropterin synthase [Actinomycetota bacterium]|nr:6-carboxytetrahydropterin synthase [Actinomycetota bacterium]